jgi:hypothetical protein
MTWTTPRTWVANTKLYDVDLNAHLRDNLSTTMPAMVTAAGQICVPVGLNEIAARDLSWSLVSSVATINSGSSDYRTLTGGPSITATTGTSALVLWGSTIDATVPAARHTVMVQGATVPDYVADYWTLRYGTQRTASRPFRGMSSKRFTGLSKGSNTFVSYYAYSGSGTTTFNDRFMFVIPL